MAKSAAPADKEALYSEILNHYKKSFNDMAGRAPGICYLQLHNTSINPIG